jgi:hypothetical protein
MKKSKFTEAQIAFILRQADEGTPDPVALVEDLGERIRGGAMHCCDRQLRTMIKFSKTECAPLKHHGRLNHVRRNDGCMERARHLDREHRHGQAW